MEIVRWRTPKSRTSDTVLPMPDPDRLMPARARRMQDRGPARRTQDPDRLMLARARRMQDRGPARRTRDPDRLMPDRAPPTTIARN